jgi:hypothetical protein
MYQTTIKIEAFITIETEKKPLIENIPIYFSTSKEHNIVDEEILYLGISSETEC